MENTTKNDVNHGFWKLSAGVVFLHGIDHAWWIFLGGFRCCIQWIGLTEILQETPIFNGKNHGFLQIFP